jgi:hypothetical protein
MDKAQEPRNPEGYTPSSEPFRVKINDWLRLDDRGSALMLCPSSVVQLPLNFPIRLQAAVLQAEN